MDLGSSPINSPEDPPFSLSPTSEPQQISPASESAQLETCWTISSERISSASYQPSCYAVGGDPEPNVPSGAFPIIPSGEEPHAIPSGSSCPATATRSSPTVCVQPNSVKYSNTRHQMDGPGQVIPVRTSSSPVSCSCRSGNCNGELDLCCKLACCAAGVGVASACLLGFIFA